MTSTDSHRGIPVRGHVANSDPAVGWAQTSVESSYSISGYSIIGKLKHFCDEKYSGDEKCHQNLSFSRRQVKFVMTASYTVAVNLMTQNFIIGVFSKRTELNIPDFYLKFNFVFKKNPKTLKYTILCFKYKIDF